MFEFFGTMKLCTGKMGNHSLRFQLAGMEHLSLVQVTCHGSGQLEFQINNLMSQIIVHAIMYIYIYI